MLPQFYFVSGKMHCYEPWYGNVIHSPHASVGAPHFFFAKLV